MALDIHVGDRITHDLDGEGVVTRTGVGPKKDLIEVMYEDNEFPRFVDPASKHIEVLNGSKITRRQSKWKVPEYAVDATSQHFNSDELAYFTVAVTRVVYRPHPWNLDKFKTDYEAVTGTICPLQGTNRSDTAWDDCAEIFLSVYPPSGMISEPLKQSGDLWYFESVSTAWKLFSCGFAVHVQ